MWLARVADTDPKQTQYENTLLIPTTDSFSGEPELPMADSPALIAPNPPTAANAITGSTTPATTINMPCIESVTLTARTANQGIEQHDTSANENTVLLGQAEYRLEGFSGSFKLRGDVKRKTENNDAGSHTQYRLAHFANIRRSDYRTQSNGILLACQCLQARRNPYPVNQEPANSRRKNPQCRQTQAYAAPLTPNSVHADDELADALIAATQGLTLCPQGKNLQHLYSDSSPKGLRQSKLRYRKPG